MRKISVLKCLSVLTALTLFAVLHPSMAGATEAEPPGTTVKCPDGNIYVCATTTMGGGTVTAYKGKGETVVTVEN